MINQLADTKYHLSTVTHAINSSIKQACSMLILVVLRIGLRVYKMMMIIIRKKCHKIELYINLPAGNEIKLNIKASNQ